jgi:outer membrane protein assembly factor BamB
LEQRLLGLTLVVVYDGYGSGQGQVWEFDTAHNKRWGIDRNLQGPIDAQVLPGNRVLLAEYNGQRVSERDLTGKILWEHRVEGNPVACQRLANGNTFIATLNAIMEVLPNKKTRYTYPVPQNQVTYAHKLRNGQIYYVSSNGVLTVLDSKDGKEIRHFKVGSSTEWLSFELLPGGNILVPQQSSNQIFEYRSDGTVVTSERAPTAYSAVRLPNGNTLACSMNTSSLFELNRTGAVVWKDPLQGRPFRVRRR